LGSSGTLAGSTMPRKSRLNSIGSKSSLVSSLPDVLSASATPLQALCHSLIRRLRLSKSELRRHLKAESTHVMPMTRV